MTRNGLTLQIHQLWIKLSSREILSFVEFINRYAVFDMSNNSISDELEQILPQLRAYARSRVTIYRFQDYIVKQPASLVGFFQKQSGGFPRQAISPIC